MSISKEQLLSIGQVIADHNEFTCSDLAKILGLDAYAVSRYFSMDPYDSQKVALVVCSQAALSAVPEAPGKLGTFMRLLYRIILDTELSLSDVRNILENPKYNWDTLKTPDLIELGKMSLELMKPFVRTIGHAQTPERFDENRYKKLLESVREDTK